MGMCRQPVKTALGLGRGIAVILPFEIAGLDPAPRQPFAQQEFNFRIHAAQVARSEPLQLFPECRIDP